MPTPYKPREMGEPEVHPGEAEYYEAAARGQFIVKRCADCGRHHHYPRSFCPYCFSEEVSFVPAKGTGKVYACTVTRRGGPVPYCVAYVTLDEGLTLLTNIVDCDLDTVRIGMSVCVVPKQTAKGVSLPMFRPVAGDSDCAGRGLDMEHQ